MNLVYYLGAGASANALPLVKNFHKRFEAFKDDLIVQLKSTGIDMGKTGGKDTKEHIAEKINEISFNIDPDNHFSPDTYAKKLFLFKQRDYFDFKFYLSMFFMYEEHQLKNIEQRWDFFFSSLIELDGNFNASFPSSISFISWNYDTQIQLAIKKYFGKEFKRGAEEFMDSLSQEKLNGSCNFIYETNGIKYSHNFEHGSEFIKVFWDVYRNLSYRINGLKTDEVLVNTLKFAWETNVKEFQTVLDACAKIEQADVIVIIGYSFPFYNRKVDLEVLNKSDLSKKEIVLQVGESDAENIKSTLVNLLGDNQPKSIRIENNLSTFYIPINF